MGEEDNRGIQIRALEQLEKLPGVPALPHVLPDYRAALRLFNERYPTESNADTWYRIRQGFREQYGDIEADIDNNIDLLKSDSLNRIAYLKRLFSKLYAGQVYYERLKNLGQFLAFPKFEELRKDMDGEVWSELDAIGYAALQWSVYAMSIDYRIESELKIEGEPVKNGWLWKEPVETDENNDLAHGTKPAGRPKKKQLEKLSDIWLGEEADFWRLIKHYAANYIEGIDGNIFWSPAHGHKNALVGFICQCQEKGWIAKNSHSATDLQNVLKNTLHITLDTKQLKTGNLMGIDPKYKNAFSSLPVRLKSPKSPI